MKNTALSLQLFGLYAIATGVTFLLYPAITTTLGLPPLLDGWTRLIGLLACALGVYYVVNAAYLPFAKASVVVRCLFGLGTLYLFLAAQMPAAILTFGVVDVIGAIFTALTLRKK